MNRRFVLFLIAQTCSNFGDWLSFSAMSYLIFTTSGLTQIGLLQGISPLVAVFVGPVIGLFIDYHPARRVMIGSNLLLALTTLGFVFLGSSVYAVVLVVKASLGVAFGAAYARFFPALIADRHLERATGWVSTMGQISTTLGIFMGTYCASLMGTQVFLVDAATFVIASVCFACIPIEVSGVSASSTGSCLAEGRFKGDIRVGLEYVLRDKGYVLLLTFFGLAHICWGVKDVAGIAIATEQFHIPLENAGGYMAMATIAEITGGFLIALGLIKNNLSYVSRIAFWVGVLSLSFIGAYFFVDQAIGLTLKFLEGLSSVIVGVLSNNQLILRAPQQMRGRISGIVGTITASLLVFGKVTAGFLSDAFGARLVYLAVGSAVLTSVLFLCRRAFMQPSVEGAKAEAEA